MSKRETFGPDCFRLRENVRVMQAHGAMVDFLHGRRLLDALSFSYGMGLDGYPSEFVEYVGSDDDDDDDDDDDYNDFGNQNNRYCGFSPKFLDKGFPNPRPAIACFKTVKRISPEEAAKNAKELVDEEEKIKKKAEKKKQKKMRQRERRRQEKLEKENAEKDKNKKVDPGTVKSKPAEKGHKNINKINNNAPLPPDPGSQISSVATDSSDSSDEEDDDDDDDGESVADDLQELDMNSCFVTNAAAIAKRKLESKPKSDRKGKKAENSRNSRVGEKKRVAEPQIKDYDNTEGSREAVNDFVTKSMELAVMGNAYAQTGNLDMAVKFFTDAIKHNPKEFKLFGNRSYCYEKMQEYEKSLIDADIALSLNPTWVKGLYRKGKALVGLKRYYDACLTFKEVLKLDSSCTDAAQELMRVQIMQLMDMGFTREQSSNALIIHGTVEKALETLSGLQGSFATATVPTEVSEEDWICAQRNPQPHKVPLRTVPQNQPRANTAVKSSSQELFPIWVGDLVPAISESKIYELFRVIGPVHSVRVLQEKRCAFVNYIKKEDCEKAIQDMHGYAIAGTSLVVRYPDRVHTHLGASKTAATTDTGKVSKLPEECFFWRTTGCIKHNRCAYKHVPEHKGIDRPKAK